MEEISIEVKQAKQLLEIIKEDLGNLDIDKIENIDYANDELKDGTKKVTIVIEIN